MENAVDTTASWQAPEAPATPFWRRMPKFFLFPLAVHSLWRIAAVSVLYAVAGYVFGRSLFSSPVSGGFLMFIVAMATSVFLSLYGFLVIERTAAGFLRQDQYPEFGERGSALRPIKMFLIMVVGPIAIAIVTALFKSWFLYGVLIIAFAALLPASTMIMTMTDSFTDAINPARCLEVARKIGKPYLALCLFLLLLLLSSQKAADWLMPSGQIENIARELAAGANPVALAGRIARTMAFGSFVLSFVGSYFFVMMCALIGYTMYQYADALGISVVGPGEARTIGKISSAGHERRTRDALIGHMVAAGEIKEAIDLLNEDLRDRPNDLGMHARLHKLLLIEGSTVRIEDHTDRYVELLVKSDNAREALPLVEGAFGRKPQWEPRDLSMVVPLARAALGASKPKLAAALIRGFDKKHREHPDIPYIYLIGAQLMLESGAPVMQARQMLQYLSARFPEHAAATEAARLMQRIERLGAAS